MKRASTIFLQIVIAALGTGIFAWLLWFPRIEGRNVNATDFEIYFRDPFLAYIYLASIPFFVGLYQAIKILGYVGQNTVISQAAVNALRTIKYCALITAGAIVAADVFLMVHARLYPEIGAADGPEGAIMLGIIITFASIVIAAAATVLQRTLQSALDIKSENDLLI